jgi:hypothetical protein
MVGVRWRLGALRERRRGAGGEVEAAAARRSLREIAFPSSVSARTRTGSESATRGTDLGQKEAATTAVATGRQRAAARVPRRARAGTGAWEGKGEMAGKLPHHDAVPRGESIDGRRQRNGGAAAGPSSSGNGGSALGFRAGGGCGLGKEGARVRAAFIGWPWSA